MFQVVPRSHIQVKPKWTRKITSDACYNKLLTTITIGRILGSFILSKNGTYEANYQSWRSLYFAIVFSFTSYLLYFNQDELRQINHKTRVTDKTGFVLQFGSRNLNIIFPFIALVIYGLTMTGLKILFPQITFIPWILYCYYYWVSAMMLCLWHTLMYCLCQTAEMIKKLATKVIRNDAAGMTITDIEILWIDLCRLAKMTGETFCYTYCYYILFLYLTLIVISYETLSILSLPINGEKFSLILTTVGGTIIAASIPFASEIASRKIGDEFIKLLTDLKIKESHPPKEMEDIDELIEITLSNEPSINLGGFVTLGNSLITSLMSTMVTYLIVLVQMKVYPLLIPFPYSAQLESMYRHRRYLLNSELSRCNLIATDQVRAYQNGILRILKYFGLMMVSIGENGTLDSKWISFSFLYCLILFGAQVYFICSATVERYHLIKRFEDRTFDDDLFLYSLFAFYFYVGLHVFLIMESKKIIAYYEQLAIFQARYYHVQGRKIDLRLKRRDKYFNLSFPVFSFVILFVVNIFNLRSVYKTFDSTVIIPIIENLISCGFIILDIEALFLIFMSNIICLNRIANELLIDIPSAFSTGEVSLMDGCGKLWMDFMSITQQFGRALSYSFGYYFVLATLTSTFELYLAIKEEHTVLILYGMSQWISIMYVIIEVDQLHNKLTYKIKVRLLDIRKRVSYNRRLKINKFLKLMKAFSGKISLGGFVNLNKGFASSVLNRITTYIIVLIQFKHGDRVDK